MEISRGFDERRQRDEEDHLSMNWFTALLSAAGLLVFVGFMIFTVIFVAVLFNIAHL